MHDAKAHLPRVLMSFTAMGWVHLHHRRTYTVSPSTSKCVLRKALFEMPMHHKLRFPRVQCPCVSRPSLFGSGGS